MGLELRISKSGAQQNWTKEEVLAGLNHFYKLYSRYPTAHEIDTFEFLPSSRSIQRQFGGLVVLRKELIPRSHSNYTQGSYRSSMASKTYKRAAKYEEEFYQFLCVHFDPIAIHEHKIIRPGNVASDYFIYFSANKGIVIDLFYAQDMHSLGGVVNIKLKRYSSLPFKTIFILVGNELIDIDTIRKYLSRRKVPIPFNILVDTENNFKVSTINQLKALSIYSR
jgi:hypothetical protein